MQISLGCTARQHIKGDIVCMGKRENGTLWSEKLHNECHAFDINGYLIYNWVVSYDMWVLPWSVGKLLILILFGDVEIKSKQIWDGESLLAFDIM